MVQAKTLVALGAFLFAPVQSIDLNVDNEAPIKAAASTIANVMVSFYTGNDSGQIPGLLPSPPAGYYWWESGAFFDTLIQYWALTGDDQYNDIVGQGILFQVGPDDDFMPPNQTHSEGNDDQSVWAAAALSAAEYNFPKPSGNTSWISLSERVFNDQAARWDMTTCGGGLRWQIFAFNNGYNYKNTAANGGFFELAARLARLTGNTTYSDWAEKAYAWSTSIGLIDDQYSVYDGTSVTNNCSAINHIQFSWYAGLYISGAAHMYNVTSGSAQWKTVLDGLLNNTLATFFNEDVVLTEISCESTGRCDTDMRAFKGLLAQSLISAITVAPYTKDTIIPKLTTSATAAAKSCNGGKSGTICPLSWNETKADGTAAGGVGEQLSALSVIQGLLVGEANVPATNATATTGGSGGSENRTQTSSTASGSASASGTRNSGASLAKSTGLKMGGMALIAWLVL